MKIHCDGLANPNPGKSTWAFVDLDTGDAKYGYLGHKTNNVAEYEAVIQAVKYARYFPDERIEIFTDSMLVVNQVTKRWKCKKPEMAKLRDRVLELLPDNVSIGWVRGADNEADHFTRVAFREATGCEPKLWKKQPKNSVLPKVCPTCHRAMDEDDNLTEQFRFATEGV